MRKLNRNLIRVLLISGAICLLGATSVLAAKYNEAPMLKVMVAAGELPPVEERLPRNPLVVPVIEKIGEYGGTLTSGYLGPGQYGSVSVVFREQGLHTNYNGTFSPSIVEKYEISEDSKTCTVHIREGIRWSDGAPFTTDDIMFWYEDIALNESLSPVPPTSIREFGLKIEKVDDYTLKFVTPEPAPVVFMRELLRNWDMVHSPRHYLKQFHPKYVSIEKLNEMAKKEGFAEWYELCRNRSEYKSIYKYPERPVLGPWVLEKATPLQLTFQRNPFYWKVDPEGNQLPYVDKVTFILITDASVMTLKAMQGELSYTHGPTLALSDYPAMKAGEKAGNYRVLLWDVPAAALCGLIPNQGHKDPVLRELFRDLRFRRALSLAIDRDEINEICALGLSKPYPITVAPGTPPWKEEFAKVNIEYDAVKANSLLDEMGLTKRDKNDYRLRPDGKPMAFTLYMPSDYAPAIQVGELVAKYWRAVGIKTDVQGIDRSLWTIRRDAGELDILAWPMGAAMLRMYVAPGGILAFMFPIEDQGIGVSLIKWFETGGKEGVEPPAYMKEAREIYDQLMRTADEEKRIQLEQQILKLQAENLTAIGTIMFPPRPVIVKNYVRNFREESNWVFELFYEKCFHIEQVFIEK